MYYLDRQQDEKFHDWAHRAFNRYKQIRESLVKKYKVRLDRYILIEKCATVEDVIYMENMKLHMTSVNATLQT